MPNESIVKNSYESEPYLVYNEFHKTPNVNFDGKAIIDWSSVNDGNNVTIVDSD